MNFLTDVEFTAFLSYFVIVGGVAPESAMLLHSSQIVRWTKVSVCWLLVYVCKPCLDTKRILEGFSLALTASVWSSSEMIVLHVTG